MFGDIGRSAIGRMLRATLLIGGLGAASAAQADSGGNHQPPAVPAQARAQGEALSQAVVELGRRHGRAVGAEKGRILADLKRAAEERHDLLADLIQGNPGEVLRLALPDRMLAGMPTEARAWLEQRAEIEGELEVLHIDMPDPADSRFAYFLKTDLGERFSLHFAGRAPDWVSGTAVRAGGVLLDGVEAQDAAGADGAIAVAADEAGIENLAYAGGNGNGGGGTPASGLTNTMGEQRTLVIAVNFQDKPTEQPWTTQQVSDTILGNTSDFFLENSFQQTWLSGDVAGWYTIPLDSTICNSSQIANLAQQEATTHGYDPGSYERIVYLFPKNACAWLGSAIVTGAESWINGTLELRYTAHELGHNLGLKHAHSLDCGATTLGNSCTTSTYGDNYDVMGTPSSGHFNAFAKDRLGWLGFGSSPPMTTASTDGTYSISPYELNDHGAKGLKVLKSIDPVTGARTWYYLEFRQAIGFDSWLAGNGNVLSGIIVHTGTENDGNTSNLLDMTPNSSASLDWSDPALVAGASFADAAAGLTITTLSANTSGATVSITVTPAVCARANPEVLVSPSESQWVAAGTAVAYTATVTNMDGTACADATYSLTDLPPLGWAGSYDNSSLTLAPGTSGTRTLTVTSPASALNGYYTVTATATNDGASTYMAATNMTYVVSNPPPNQLPVAVDDSAPTAADIAVTVAVLANDSDPDADSLSVTTATQSANGSVTVNANNTVTYTPNAGFDGTDGFGYTVSDGRGGVAGANVAITVTQPNRAPVAVNDNGATTEGVAITIAVLVNDSDPDGDLLSVVAATQGANGSVSVNSGSAIYTPNNGFAGTDGFTYTVSDGNGGIASANVTVSVVQLNQPPVAVSDKGTTTAGKPVTIAVLPNDNDADGDILRVAAVTQGTKGTVKINIDGTVTYTPGKGFRSGDAFAYTVSDGRGGTASASVSVKKVRR